MSSALLALVAAAPAHAAAPSIRASTTVSLSGSTVTAKAVLSASPSTTVELAGVCARDAQDRNVDFPPAANVSLARTAKTLTVTRALAAGTYRYVACVRAKGVWSTIGAVQSFTVAAPSSTPVPGLTPAPAAATGSSMPTGDLPGWKQVFADDFATPVALGGFPGPAYSAKWTSYDGFTDTSGAGSYSMSKVLSVQNGSLDLNLRTEGGKALVAAPVPLQAGQWGGWAYGRYSVRFRADAVPGYKTAWLLWPDSDDWNDGEIDFPEGELSGSIEGFVHQPGNPSQNAFAVNTGARYTAWHTATIEWLPSGVTFLLDGRIVGTTRTSPSKAMHLVLQTETADGRPAASAAGHVQIDWLTMYRRS